MTFVERGIGDVLMAWENEAYLAINQLGKDKFEIVVPSVSASSRSRRSRWSTRSSTGKAPGGRPGVSSNFSTPPRRRRWSRANYYRPRDPEIAKQYGVAFPTLRS